MKINTREHDIMKKNFISIFIVTLIFLFSISGEAFSAGYGVFFNAGWGTTKWGSDKTGTESSDSFFGGHPDFLFPVGGRYIPSTFS